MLIRYKKLSHLFIIRYHFLNTKVLSKLITLLPYLSDLVLAEFLWHSPESNIFHFFEGEP